MRKTETREEKGGREENESFSLSLSLAFFPLFFDLVFFLLPSHEPAGSCSLLLPRGPEGTFPTIFPGGRERKRGREKREKREWLWRNGGLFFFFSFVIFFFFLRRRPHPSPLKPLTATFSLARPANQQLFYYFTIGDSRTHRDKNGGGENNTAPLEQTKLFSLKKQCPLPPPLRSRSPANIQHFKKTTGSYKLPSRTRDGAK